MTKKGEQRAIILASSSPRRRELLGLSGLEFGVRPAAADETPYAGESPEVYAQRMAHTKTEVVAATARAGEVVVGADTIVVLDGEASGEASILGKPRDPDQAIEMLQRLRGRTHRVLTAIRVADTASGEAQDELVTVHVPMRAYSDDEIKAYVATGHPLDKAGAYGIQYARFQPVDEARFSDCFATVMGLPVCSVLRQLARVGLAAPLAPSPGDCQHFEPGACPIYPRISRGGE